MEIKYLSSEDIDKTKWNSCVHYAVNGNIFGYKWYLDAIAREWDCLVEGDYESVMPLPFKKDWLGRKHIYQPEMMRELGVYSIHVLSKGRVKKFLEAIPDDFVKVQIDLNEQIGLPDGMDYLVGEKTNYQLLLEKPYEELAEDFSRDLLLKLEKAEKAGLRPKANLKPEKVADFYNKYAPFSPEKEQNFHAMHRIMWNILHRGWGFASGIEDSNGELLAVNFFIYSHSKVLSYVPVESPRGKEVGALAYLMNTLLRTHAEKRQILDFNTVSEDTFAAQFGATENAFQSIKKDKRFFKI